MSAGHTVGNLAVADINGDGCMGLVVNGNESILSVDDTNFAYVFNAEDARRLAACWNAFDGMPTEAPEELSGIGGVQGLTNDLGEAMDKLVAARALLADVAKRGFCSEHNMIRIRAFLTEEAA
jgi:hypothetical protein